MESSKTNQTRCTCFSCDFIINHAVGKRTVGDEVNVENPYFLASFPGSSRLQFLIACSMQKQMGKAWEKESRV